MSSIHEEWLAILVLLTGVLLSALTTLIGVCLRLLAGRLVLATLLLALAALLAICPPWFGSGEGFEGTESPLRTSGSGLYWELASKEGEPILPRLHLQIINSMLNALRLNRFPTDRAIDQLRTANFDAYDLPQPVFILYCCSLQ